MDLREIQALHEQYASQPIVIDITSHTKAMPALPAPERSTSGRPWIGRVMSRCRRLAKPTAIAVAVAMAAGTVGVSAAKLWRVMHTAAHHAPAATVAPPPSRADAPQGASPADAVAPRALTSAELGGDSNPPAGAMAKIDPSALTARAPVATATRSPGSDIAQAEASPIHVPRRSATPPVQTVTASAPAVAQPATQARMPQPQPQPAIVKQTAVQPQTDSESTELPHPPRPVHHAMPRKHVAPATQPDATPAPSAQTPTAAKSGDVQLF
ncbi:hypothetical protein ACRPM7_05130 [Burkholderia vietnamiensis]|uniref:hypothetical protein n=1 Tax=Burkholderia vietnamiensis TaxID=60552 RepID=UPI001ADB110B|nr:hypothetical protein [Burkholderia vietnamiensis]QTK86114.1 hypothetical protein J4D21_15005 [Burkholderia vietnamiensis]